MDKAKWEALVVEKLAGDIASLRYELDSLTTLVKDYEKEKAGEWTSDSTWDTRQGVEIVREFLQFRIDCKEELLRIHGGKSADAEKD